MKKIILILIVIISLYHYAWAKPIKDLPEPLLQACITNLQVEDCMLMYDKPYVNLGVPYSWVVTYNPGQYKKGVLNIPCGAVWDVKSIRVKYKIRENSLSQIRLYGRYNRKSEFANDYIKGAHAKPVSTNCEYILSPEESAVGDEKEIVYENDRWAPDNQGYMEAFGIDMTGDARCVIEIFSIEFIKSDGSVFDLWSYDWDMRAYEPVPGMNNDPFPSLDHTIYIGMSSLEQTCEEGRNRILRLKQLIPNLGCDGNGYATALAYYKDFFIKNNIPAYYQFGGSCDIEPIVSENQAHLETVDGKSRDIQWGSGSYHHEFDWTSDAVKSGFKEAIKRCGEMGIDGFQFIDAVWQYSPTINWGYGEKTIEAFRKDLLEEDGGIPVGVYGKTEKRIHFHEYLMESAGIEITPADCKISSWEEYIPCVSGFTPPEEAQIWTDKSGTHFECKPYFIHIMLKHYEWLKLFAEVGEEGMKYGCDIVAMPNGSNWGNANDYAGLLYTSTVKYLVDETHFYHPDHLLGGYAQLPAWRGLMTKYNKHHRLISEVGLGGGANIYLAPLFSYVMTYSLQNLGHYDSLQTDWIWGGVHENSDIHGVNAFVEFLFKAWGFNDATEDNGERVGDYKKAIRLIAPQGNLVVEKDKSTFRNVFYKGSFPYMLMDWREYRLLNPNTNLMVVDTTNMPQTLADELISLVKKQKMSIFLHSYVAGAESDGNNYTNIWYAGNSINKPDLFGDLLGQVTKEEDVEFTQAVIDKAFLSANKIKLDSYNIPVNYKGEYYDIFKNAKAIISCDGKPILSVINVNKNFVFYYHINASVDNDLDNFVMDLVYKLCNIKEEGELEGAYLQRYMLKNGAEALAVYNRNSFETFDGPPSKWGYFKINDEGISAKVKVEPLIKGQYVVYDFMNEEIINKGSAKSVSIEMKDLTANLYYIIPQAKADDFIKTLKERKEKLNYWEKYRFEKFPENW
ncbi:MAG: hypothetical protein IJS60_10355 [Abditibacteriota bacterium]|nr:hypothetical protein [Abditibacteriota bacterium]